MANVVQAQPFWDSLAGPTSMWVEDTGTGTAFGPFGSGLRIKYIEVNRTEPNLSPMVGNNGLGGDATAVNFQLRGRGDAVAVYFDEDGNGIRTLCLVPPRPQ